MCLKTAIVNLDIIIYKSIYFFRLDREYLSHVDSAVEMTKISMSTSLGRSLKEGT